MTLTVMGAACGGSDGPNLSGPDGDQLCSLPQELLWASLPPDAIPALTLPEMVTADDPGADFLFDSDRVLGIVVNGEARAYPHNILWWHEIINDRIGETWVSVTFCPLTGSGLAFDPTLNGNRLDLGVSGLLFANNLVMFDRRSGAVFGPQLFSEGKCATFRSARLKVVPVQEMSWSRWRELHPDTKVVSGQTGFSRNYRQYPYGSYRELNNGDLLFPMTVDRTRPIKERVLAIRTSETAGRGYPFGELSKMGDRVALNETVDGAPVTVFYESAEGESAMAYDPTVDGQLLTFEADGEFYRDAETGSLWTLSGKAVSGSLAGRTLRPIADSWVVFWFAWKHFLPDGKTFTT